METVSGGNASVTSPDNEIEAVVDTALSESETVSGNDIVIGSNEYTEVVQVDLSSLETELVGVNEKLALLITLICVCIIWTVVKNVNKFFDWFF
mgnify:FL=1|jgi:hypothetical protein